MLRIGISDARKLTRPPHELTLELSSLGVTQQCLVLIRRNTEMMKGLWRNPQMQDH